jgi:Family of unknown function (DUF6512)
MKSKVKKWEMVGIIIIILLGTLSHFAYDWSNQHPFLALITPINESVWEHLKLAFYPILIYASIEYLLIGDPNKNFLFAKILGAITACMLIIFLFYGYTTFMKENIIIDIIIFMLSVAAAQLISYGTIQSKIYFGGINYLAILVLVASVLVFSSYTYEPPHTDPFIDSKTNTSGLK